jgi:hypothetical protein
MCNLDSAGTWRTAPTCTTVATFGPADFQRPSNIADYHYYGTVLQHLMLLQRSGELNEQATARDITTAGT